MRRSLFSVALGLAALAIASVNVVLAAPAGATPPSGSDVITFAGSDTTQDVISALFGCADFTTGSTIAGKCTDLPAGYTNPVYNLKFPLNMKDPVTVPADPYCQGTVAPFNAGITYTKNIADGSPNGAPTAVDPQITPPAGSGAGRQALFNSVNKAYPAGTSGQDATTNRFNSADDAGNNGGCIDIARSSGFASASNAYDVHQDFYAFALDSVGISSPSLNAPASLTLQQVRNIFACNYDNWSQVGGRNAPIQRIVPQAGSGTGDFFMTNILGLTGSTNTARTTGPPGTGINFPDSGTNPDTSAATSCPDAKFVEENNGNAVLAASLRNSYQNMVMPYSAGKWVYQANSPTNPSVDIRGGERPIAIVNNDASTGIPGAAPVAPVRWVGSAWRLNDATVLLNGTYNKRTAAITNTSISSGTITAAASTFTQDDVGKSVTQSPVTFLGPSTTITAVDGTGAIATVSPAPTADGGTGTVTLFDVNRNTMADGVTANSVASDTNTQVLTGAAGTFRARDVGLTVQGSNITPGTVIVSVNGDGSQATVNFFAAATGTQNVTIGWALISEKNPHVLAGAGDIQYPGTRFVYNVLNRTSPDYVNARNLVGFDDSSASGTVSKLCSGDATLAGRINSNGFLALPALDRDGPGVGNDTLRSCVLRKTT